MLTISKTPLRISFFGGGSDLPAFIEKEDGAVLSATINKFVYVCINSTQRPIRFFHEDVQIGLANMRNLIVKETLKEFNITEGLDIVSMSDVHAVGAGLGGSSAFTVGLINGLMANQYWYDAPITKETLAQKACEIEIERCDYPIGIQDQYAAAYGGFNLMEFYSKPKRHAIIDCSFEKFRTSQKWLQIHNTLENRLILIYSGTPRNTNAGTMLQRQQTSIRDDKFDLMIRIRNRAWEAEHLLINEKLDQFGELLHENWLDKKTLAIDLSNEYIDNIYNLATKNGAIGGKLLGAGGGGFMLFYVPNKGLRQPLIEAILHEFPNSRHYPFQFYQQGSTITKV